MIASEQTTITVSPDAGLVNTTSAANANDPGYGYEIISNCDHDGNTVTPDEGCRFFSTSNAATVTAGNSQPLDFSASSPVGYYHFTIRTVIDSWEVLRIWEEDVPDATPITDFEPGSADAAVARQ